MQMKMQTGFDTTSKVTYGMNHQKLMIDRNDADLSGQLI